LQYSASSRFALATLAILFTLTPVSRAVDAVVPRANPPTANSIVIGFVGGFVSHNDLHHGTVQLAQRIRRTVPQTTYVGVFENRHRKQAYETVMTLLDTNRDGILSSEEKNAAHIVIFGHSWGASAAVLLARELRRQAIPVLLTVQVDSVAKLWQNDTLLPDNVSAAINFYQTQGFVHGRRQIAAADPAKTEVLGNVLLDYKRNPIQCPEASWWYRHLAPGHMQSECDPRLWSQIETLVKLRLEPSSTHASIFTTPIPRP
jgi:hypothetical protein